MAVFNTADNSTGIIRIQRHMWTIVIEGREHEYYFRLLLTQQLSGKQFPFHHGSHSPVRTTTLPFVSPAAIFQFVQFYCLN